MNEAYFEFREWYSSPMTSWEQAVYVIRLRGSVMKDGRLAATFEAGSHLPAIIRWTNQQHFNEFKEAASAWERVEGRPEHEARARHFLDAEPIWGSDGELEFDPQAEYEDACDPSQANPGYWAGAFFHRLLTESQPRPDRAVRAREVFHEGFFD